MKLNYSLGRIAGSLKTKTKTKTLEENRVEKERSKKRLASSLCLWFVLSHKQIKEPGHWMSDSSSNCFEKLLNREALWSKGQKTTSGTRASAQSCITSLLHLNFLIQSFESPSTILEITVPTAYVGDQSLTTPSPVTEFPASPSRTGALGQTTFELHQQKFFWATIITSSTILWHNNVRKLIKLNFQETLSLVPWILSGGVPRVQHCLSHLRDINEQDKNPYFQGAYVLAAKNMNLTSLCKATDQGNLLWLMI